MAVYRHTVLFDLDYLFIADNAIDLTKEVL